MSINIKSLLYYIFFASQILTIVGLLLKNNVHAIYEVALVILLFISYLYLEKRLKLSISNYIRGSVLLTLFIHTFVGKFLNFYLTVQPFDNVLHMYGSYSVSLFFFAVAVQILRVDFPTTLNKFLFIVLIGLSAGVLYEISEFLLDVGLKPDIPNQAGLIDTNLDLIADLIGSSVAAYQECFVTSTLKIGPKSKP